MIRISFIEIPRSYVSFRLFASTYTALRYILFSSRQAVFSQTKKHTQPFHDRQNPSPAHVVRHSDQYLNPGILHIGCPLVSHIKKLPPAQFRIVWHQKMHGQLPMHLIIYESPKKRKPYLSCTSGTSGQTNRICVLPLLSLTISLST